MSCSSGDARKSKSIAEFGAVAATAYAFTAMSITADIRCVTARVCVHTADKETPIARVRRTAQLDR